MHRFFSFLIVLVTLFLTTGLLAQSDSVSTKEGGHTNNNKFKQLYQEFSTPNSYRTASGAPGIDYYQQQVDYIMDIELDDKNERLYGEEKITYTNNSPDELSYLWVQLDQNIRKKDAIAIEKDGNGAKPLMMVEEFVSDYLKDPFDGGFNIQSVKGADNRPIKFLVNETMMRIDLPTPITVSYTHLTLPTNREV